MLGTHVITAVEVVLSTVGGIACHQRELVKALLHKAKHATHSHVVSL